MRVQLSHIDCLQSGQHDPRAVGGTQVNREASFGAMQSRVGEQLADW